MMKKMMGFTLAEVLTTLMVIGVVAAMTIPTLMNSTNDQQLKVAYKKAMSILSQGTQLMVAKEAECTVGTDAQLAACFAKNVLSGNVVDKDNGNTANQNNVVSTSDGIAYAFYYFGEDSSVDRSLEDICGSMSDLGNLKAGYDGSAAKCVVVVDLNGFSKGKRGFNEAGSTTTRSTGTAISTAYVGGSEQQAIIITGNGVRSVFVGTGTDSDTKLLNSGYNWMYNGGSESTVAPYSGS